MSRLQRTRTAQTLIVAVVALAILAIVAVLCIDTGHLFATRSSLQNTADAAALAGTQELVLQRGDGQSEQEARTLAAEEALQIATANHPGASCEVLFGKFEGDQFSPLGVETEATAVKLTSARDEGAAGGPLRGFFSSIMGVESFSVRACAVSEIASGISAIRGDLRPFAVHKDDIKPVGQKFRIPLGNWTTGDDGEEMAPGNFGLLNLDGGALGTDELIDWIQDGFDGECRIDPDVGYLWIDGTCGVRRAITSELEAIIGEMVFVCVYDTITGVGSNASFRVIWFAGAVVTDIKWAGVSEQSYIEMEMVKLSYVPYCDVGGVPDSNLVKIQLVQ